MNDLWWDRWLLPHFRPLVSFSTPWKQGTWKENNFLGVYKEASGMKWVSGLSYFRQISVSMLDANPQKNGWNKAEHCPEMNRSYWYFNYLTTNSTKWSNTLKQFVGKLPTNYLSVFVDFVGLALKGYLHYKTITSQNELYYVLKDIQAFVFLTISWFTKSVTSWWVLVN